MIEKGALCKECAIKNRVEKSKKTLKIMDVHTLFKMKK